MKITQNLTVGVASLVAAGAIGGAAAIALTNAGEPPQPQEVRIVQLTSEPSATPITTPSPIPEPTPVPPTTRLASPAPKPMCTRDESPSPKCTTKPPVVSTHHPSIAPTRAD